MHILTTGCEHTGATFLRLDNGMCRLIFGHIFVYKQESTTLEITLVVIQVDEACVMEWAVGFLLDQNRKNRNVLGFKRLVMLIRSLFYLVYMSMPVLVVHCFRRGICDARKERRMC